MSNTGMYKKTFPLNKREGFFIRNVPSYLVDKNG